MGKTAEQDFLDSLPDSENDFLRGIPDANKKEAPYSLGLKSFGKATLDTLKSFLPPMSVKDIQDRANPQIGTSGISKYLEEAGKKVTNVADVSAENLPDTLGRKSPIAAATLGTAYAMRPGDLTPSSMAQMVGSEAPSIAAPMISDALKSGVKKLAVGSEMMTNVKPGVFQNVIEKPSTILPETLGGPKGMAEAKANYVNTAQEAGFLKPEVASASPSLAELKGQKNPFTSPKEVAGEYFNKISNGESLTPEELFHAYRETSDAITPMTRINGKYARMVKFKNALRDELARLSPEWAQAAEDYGQSATRSQVTNVLPRTNTGKPSLGRGTFTTIAGGAAGGPGGALLGMAASSPLLHGLAYATAGAGIDILKTALGNPVTGIALLSDIQALLREKDKK